MSDLVERLLDHAEARNLTDYEVDCAEAAAEIKRLRAWKAEASEVLARWEEVAELVPMQLGDVKSQAVKDWVQKVQAAAIQEALSKLEGES